MGLPTIYALTIDTFFYSFVFQLSLATYHNEMTLLFR
jgi:hypothetical protein